MMEMKYWNNLGTVIVLAKGKIGKFYWCIVSFGTHPCAYVGLPKGHKYFGKSYNDIPISCHGGLTYSNHELTYQIVEMPNVYWIGWDYAHAGDYFCSPATGLVDGLGDKKWTTEEIKEEVMRVIKQLKKK